MMCRLLLIVCTGALAAGCPLASRDGHYRPHGHLDITFDVSPSEDAIVFNGVGAGGRDLFLLDLASREVTRIAESEDYEVAPSFSPDGQLIVYAGGMPGDRADHIFTITRDGTSKHQLTSEDANDTSPCFSPNGSHIVFARDKTYNWGGLAANWENGGVICVIDADGKNERQLTPDDLFAFAPCFSLDGESVYYATNDGLWSVPIDGATPAKQINATSDWDQRLSPDRRRIAYSQGKYAPDQELFVAAKDGSQATKLPTSQKSCFTPVWSPDGERIYFRIETWPQGPTGVPKRSLWRINLDGSNEEQIADAALFDNALNWTPASSQ